MFPQSERNLQDTQHHCCYFKNFTWSKKAVMILIWNRRKINLKQQLESKHLWKKRKDGECVYPASKPERADTRWTATRC